MHIKCFLMVTSQRPANVTSFRFPFHAIRPLDRTRQNILIERLPFESHLVTTSVLLNLVQLRTWCMSLAK